MKAIVLAGGKGEGLLPYTHKIQKEAITILGKAIINYTIDGLKKAGIKEFEIVVNEKGSQIEEEVEKLDVSLETIVQKRQGIDGAILDGMEKIDDDIFVLAFGDIIAPAEFYKSLMDTYIMTGRQAVIPLIPVSEGTETYGLVKIIDNKLKVVKESSTLALGGAYILPKPKDNFTSLLDYIDLLSSRDKLNYFIWSESWVDIGYPEDLLFALETLLRRKESMISDKAEISKNAIIGKGVIVEDNATIEDYAVIKGPAYIGKNAYIGSFSLVRDYSSVEEGAKVGAYCEIAHSLIEPFAEVGSKSYLTYSIVGKRAKIGASVVTASYPAQSLSRPRFNKLGALISPEKVIKHGSVIEAGMKI
ncbi:sugar phosphate nucleotidyltransferase [Sulfolobus sp. E11-6]|uniref:sugar phosphate nucleotidyltransferase n=1 Tax=Sulfolobus sp. E11-6 TaxID=2663020 RepID=UPI001297EB2B|nr:NDP-sugar synthase [Sulfolobus sp. E11-6]QGA67669.1 NTP transferase domain-containing protein [Sulfolobus sp. E11-6]